MNVQEEGRVGGYIKSRAETARICSVTDIPSKKMT